MTAVGAQTAELWALVHRAKGALELLPPALESRDLLTARYAAATLTQVGDQIETALLTLDRHGPSPEPSPFYRRYTNP